MPEPAAPHPDPGPATTWPRPSPNGTAAPKPPVPPMPSEVTKAHTRTQRPATGVFGTAMSPLRKMGAGNRGTFRPEPIPAAIPASERGYFKVAPEPGRPGQFRLWLYGDGSQRGPRSILLTLRDVRGLCMFLADVESGGRAAGQIASTAARPPPPGRGRSG